MAIFYKRTKPKKLTISSSFENFQTKLTSNSSVRNENEIILSSFPTRHHIIDFRIQADIFTTY